MGIQEIDIEENNMTLKTVKITLHTMMAKIPLENWIS